MKTNAPDKIYCTLTEGGFYLTTIKPEPPFTDGVEYTRTNAFIEKAAKWLDETLRNTDFYENEIELMVEGFKKAMKL